MSINWGILGAGNISRQFVHDLLLSNSGEAKVKHIVKTIACSNHSKGQAFITDCNINDDNNDLIKPVVQTYDELYNNNEVTVVYIGTPHVFHYEQVKACLNNGKHVLCEKPFTINVKEAQELFALAKAKNLVLMEAVWSRFIPIMHDLKAKSRSEIGDVFRIFVDLSFNADLPNCDKSSRIRDRNLGAGALLDIGIYPITYSRFLLDDKWGKDHSEFTYESIVSVDPVDKVDYNTSMIFKYPNVHAICTCSNYADSPKPFGRIDGTKGWIELYADNPARLRSFKIFQNQPDGQPPKVTEVRDDSDYNGFIYEANAIVEDINHGQESTIMPPDETLLVMGIMDDIRYKNNFYYPLEE